MAYNIIKVVSSLFEKLETKVDLDSENAYRVVECNRRIEEDQYSDLVEKTIRRAKCKIFDVGILDKYFIVEYNSNKYLVIGEHFKEERLSSLGIGMVDDNATKIACGMLAIYHNYIGIKEKFSCLDIIDQCLGIEPEEGEIIFFNINNILYLYEEYAVLDLNSSAINLEYREDYNRINAYLMVDDYLGKLSENTCEYIKDLLLLDSSRSVAIPIIEALQSHFINHTYLGIYQCLEYLFIVNRALKYSSKYSFELTNTVQMIIEEGIRMAERMDIKEVISKASFERAIKPFYDKLILDSSNLGDEIIDEKESIIQKVSEMVYKVRCNIAHLKYRQENLSVMDNMKQLVENLIQITYSVYNEMNSQIIDLCSNTMSWKPMEEINLLAED